MEESHELLHDNTFWWCDANFKLFKSVSYQSMTSSIILRIVERAVRSNCKKGQEGSETLCPDMTGMLSDFRFHHVNIAWSNCFVSALTCFIPFPSFPFLILLATWIGASQLEERFRDANLHVVQAGSATV